MKELKHALEKEKQDLVNQIEVVDPIIVSKEESPRNHHEITTYEIEDVIAMRNEIIKLQYEAEILNKKLRLAKQTLVYVNAWIVPDNVRKTVENTLKSLANKK